MRRFKETNAVTPSNVKLLQVETVNVSQRQSEFKTLKAFGDRAKMIEAMDRSQRLSRKSARDKNWISLSRRITAAIYHHYLIMTALGQSLWN